MNSTEDSSQNVFLLSTDLMVSSQVQLLARRYEVKFQTCSNLDVFREAIEETKHGIAILDLFHLPAPLDEIMQLVSSIDKITTLAFGPHVRTELLQQAKEACCDLVIPRSQLDRQLEKIFLQDSAE